MPKNNLRFNYLSAEDILVIHSEIIDATGGLHGVRDFHLFGSIIERPKTSFGGKEIYKDVFEKAAVYMESISRYHVFLDGNKRTSIAIAARFLFVNGYTLSTTNENLESFTLEVVVEKLSLEDIASWLKKHSKRVK